MAAPRRRSRFKVQNLHCHHVKCMQGMCSKHRSVLCRYFESDICVAPLLQLGLAHMLLLASRECYAIGGDARLKNTWRNVE